MRTEKPDQLIVPKLKSLSFRDLDIFFQQHNKLLDTLKERRTHGVGLKGLIIRSCRVLNLESKKEFEGLVEKITWENVTEISDYDTGTEEETSSDEEYYRYWRF
jgi:hypothetical protein